MIGWSSASHNSYLSPPPSPSPSPSFPHPQPHPLSLPLAVKHATLEELQGKASGAKWLGGPAPHTTHSLPHSIPHPPPYPHLHTLNLTLSLSLLQINMPHLRNYKAKHQEPSGWVVQRLTQLLPMDIWFYKYATQMHNIRWQRYAKQKYGQNINLTNTSSFIESLPQTISGCKTTRFIISCPQEKYYFHWNIWGETNSFKQLALLPKSWDDN